MRNGKGVKKFPVAIKDPADEAAQAAVAQAFRDALATYGVEWPMEADRAYQVHLVFARGNYRRADADNLMKTVLDGLTGVAWVDDSQAVRGTWAIDYTPRREKGIPWTMVQVRRLPHSWQGTPLPLDA
jgi:Holliday junction resolvase RusA-like endonuclease